MSESNFGSNHFTLATSSMALGKRIDIGIRKLNLRCKLKPPPIIITSELNIDKECIEMISIGGDFDLVLV